jgi:hypothetical protein
LADKSAEIKKNTVFIVASLRVNSNHDNGKKEKKREEHRNEGHSSGDRSPHDAEDHVEVAGASGAGFVSLG